MRSYEKAVKILRFITSYFLKFKRSWVLGLGSWVLGFRFYVLRSQLFDAINNNK